MASTDYDFSARDPKQVTRTPFPFSLHTAVFHHQVPFLLARAATSTSHDLVDVLFRSLLKANAELCELKKQQEALSKKINKKVMNMLDKAEAEYQDLVTKRKVRAALRSHLCFGCSN